MVVALTEIMPVRVRTAGFSLAYSLATALFGGFTPAISTFLIEVTGNRAVAGLWLMFAAACGLPPRCSPGARVSRSGRRRWRRAGRRRDAQNTSRDARLSKRLRCLPPS